MNASEGMEQLGRFVRDRRRELGLTQTGLGLRLGWAQERVSLLENARYGLPALPQLLRLSEALEVASAQLLGQLGVEFAPDDRSGVPYGSDQMQSLLRRISVLNDNLEAVGSGLHDAERRLTDAATLCASVRAGRERMRALLASCRESSSLSMGS